MNTLNYIIWTFDPALFSIPGIDYAPRWYGVLFALGFILSQQAFFWIFKKEGRPERDVERVTTYMVVATIIGARLGHCLFYNPAYYLSNPLDILKIWEGGLASHGGAIGILVAIYLFCRKYQYRYLWMLDRLVIVVALTGAMIRTGNLFNSEMEGTLTNSNVGVVYARATYDYLSRLHENIEDIDFKKDDTREVNADGHYPITAVIEFERGYEFSLADRQRIASYKNSMMNQSEIRQHVAFDEGPLKMKDYAEGGSHFLEIYMYGKVRHAAQLYEAAYCLALMLLLFWVWYNKREVVPQGFNFALFMIILWAARFVDEFFKMPQEAFEEDMVLNMGQILSIPLTLAGFVILILVYRGSRKMSDFQ